MAMGIGGLLGGAKRAKGRLLTGLGAVGLVENWPAYLMDYFGFVRGNRAVYRLRNGVSYATRPGTGDKGVINDIWIRNTYLPEGFAIGESDTVVDIGAHIGVFSILAAKFAKRGRVYSYEPFPENFRMVMENIRLNGAWNVSAFNCAVSDTPGDKKLFLSKEASCHSLYRFDSQGESTAAVRATTLDDIIRSNGLSGVDFLKIDCEGAEYGILMNASDDALARIGKISMEYHDLGAGGSGMLMRDFLVRKGFRVAMSLDRPMIYARR